MKHLYIIVCPAEALVLGTMALVSGQAISEQNLRLDFVPAAATTKEDILRVANTGQPLVCPRCKNQVVLGDGRADLGDVIKESVRIVVGSTKIK